MRFAGCLCAVCTLLLAGCAVGPNYQRPAVSAPATYRGQAQPDAESLADLAWWDVFPDPGLAALVKEAMANNNDLRGAVARIEQARNLALVARSEYFPQVGYDAGAQRAHGVYKANPELALPSTRQTQNLFLAGLSTAWEIDAWGRLRRFNEAALADYLASRQGRRAIMLSLVSDVTQAYFELQELDRRLAIARSSAGAFQSTYALFNRRFGAGITSRLAVTRAESEMARATGQVADIERQIAVKEHQICVLAGRNPGPVTRDPPKDALEVPAAIPAGLPSTLIGRRPDLLQSEQFLVRASAEVGIAKADYFPRIGLTALFGRVSPELSNLTSGSASVAALAAAGGGPIFTGGQLRGQYRAAMAVFEQARYRYLQDVLRAFQEVSDALISQQKLTELETQQKRQVAALNASVTIANKRYLGGLASYYEVLEAQQLLYPAEIALSQTRRDRMIAVVQLYRALGGGWRLTDTQWEQGRP